MRFMLDIFVTILFSLAAGISFGMWKESFSAGAFLFVLVSVHLFSVYFLVAKIEDAIRSRK